MLSSCLCLGTGLAPRARHRLKTHLYTAHQMQLTKPNFLNLKKFSTIFKSKNEVIASSIHPLLMAHQYKHIENHLIQVKNVLFHKSICRHHSKDSCKRTSECYTCYLVTIIKNKVYVESHSCIGTGYKNLTSLASSVLSYFTWKVRWETMPRILNCTWRVISWHFVCKSRFVIYPDNGTKQMNHFN